MKKISITQAGAESVKVQIGNESCVLDGGQIDDLLATLGSVRAETRKSLPPYPEGQKTMFIVDPRWEGRVFADISGGVLSFLHRGFGWVHFQLPLNEVANIAKFLEGIFPIQPPASPGKH